MRLSSCLNGTFCSTEDVSFAAAMRHDSAAGFHLGSRLSRRRERQNTEGGSKDAKDRKKAECRKTGERRQGNKATDKHNVKKTSTQQRAENSLMCVCVHVCVCGGGGWGGGE
jgi:hypothetical protein